MRFVNIDPTYTLYAEVNPVAWKAPTLGTKRIGPRVVPYAAPNAEVASFQEALKEALEPQWEGRAPITAQVTLEWHFCRQLSRYQSASGRWVTKHRQDLTNLVKSAEDALQPWLIHNDVQVIASHAYLDRQEADVIDPYVALGIAVQKLS